MRARLPLAAGLLAFALAGPARAQTDACAAFKWPVARERQAFGGTLPPLASGGAYPGVGTAVTVTLAPQGSVAYTAKPKRAPKSAPAHGAELTGTVVEAGTYQVTLSDEAWIDLAQDGRTLRSTGFSGKEGCPGVRKSVRFDLKAGPVTIALSDAAATSLKLDLLKAE